MNAVEVRDLSLFYGTFQALKSVSLDIPAKRITALIGPSGCGKSTFLRAVNRMNDLIDGVRTTGQVIVDGRDIYEPGTDLLGLRQKVGMVFQRPNPFPLSVFDNVVYGLRVHGVRDRTITEERLEGSLESVHLWAELKDKLDRNALSLSGEQQQRLCIARLVAVKPEIVLMDEPCSALDPAATSRIEDLMAELKKQYTIVIVTHNMQQAARASDETVFLTMGDDRAGYLVEKAPTAEIFTNPRNQLTEDYVSGRFG